LRGREVGDATDQKPQEYESQADLSDPPAYHGAA
jgi:hypothetical protein